MSETQVMRVARPTGHLATIKQMHLAGLGLSLLGEFADHDGFDGVIATSIAFVQALIRISCLEM